MRAIFADTFYWIAITSSDDLSHDRALAVSQSLRPQTIITSEDVIVEYLAYFSAAQREVRQNAGRIVASLLTNPKILVVQQSHKSFMNGLDLYLARPDKGYSLTDCISMLIMKKHGLTEVLTNDRHFEQEGFRALFRD